MERAQGQHGRDGGLHESLLESESLAVTLGRPGGNVKQSAHVTCLYQRSGQSSLLLE